MYPLGMKIYTWGTIHLNLFFKRQWPIHGSKNFGCTRMWRPTLPWARHEIYRIIWMDDSHFFCSATGVKYQSKIACLKVVLLYMLGMTTFHSSTRISTLWFRYMLAPLCLELNTMHGTGTIFGAEPARCAHLRIRIIPQAVAALWWTVSADDDAEMQWLDWYILHNMQTLQGNFNSSPFLSQHLFNACNYVNELKKQNQLHQHGALG